MKNDNLFSGEMPGKTKPQICGIGQPLLDITATVGDGFLNRYGLNSNDSILANEDHTNIFQVSLHTQCYHLKIELWIKRLKYRLRPYFQGVTLHI